MSFLKMLPILIVLAGIIFLGLSPILGLFGIATRKRGSRGGIIIGVILMALGAVFWIWVLGGLSWPPRFG
jgi:hypothetical protein